ncbi:MAG: UDP-4-amino-4,6-dideoxy-N-acetyl-beta-L-altrosamine transaminase [Emcibacter sp.]|nr:UDP-4-amino-4,6-dideoxy-N-acetyl-beta-L-altrosamine transaminase [Emcibacter sp.]
MRDHKYLPYGRQYLDDDDIQAVVDVLQGDWLTTGPTVQKFEDKLRQTVKSDYAVSCSSGTAALHMAYMALNIGTGDRVIVPAISFVATANAAVYCGADILFTDVDPDTGMMRAQDVLALIGTLSPEELQSVAAITAVNLTGEVAEIEAISIIARQYGWKIIVDSCHALGTTYLSRDGKKLAVGDCYFSDMEVFSFHPVKTIAMGEGGAITTNDQDLYDRLCLLRNHGIERDAEKWISESKSEIENPPPWVYEMQILGYNYRQSDIHCALGLSQLDKLPEFTAHRRRLVVKYDQLFMGLSAHVKPINSARGCSAARHLYVVLIDFKALGISRLDFIRELSSRNVGSQVHYMPIYAHPFYREKYGPQTRCGAEEYYARALSLPLHVNMSRDDVDYVTAQISDIITGIVPA